MRELLTPKPLRELRIKADYLHHQTIDGAAGIKICANNLEGVVAGSACMVPYEDVKYDLEVLREDDNPNPNPTPNPNPKPNPNPHPNPNPSPSP